MDTTKLSEKEMQELTDLYLKEIGKKDFTEEDFNEEDFIEEDFIEEDFTEEDFTEEDFIEEEFNEDEGIENIRNTFFLSNEVSNSIIKEKCKKLIKNNNHFCNDNYDLLYIMFTNLKNFIYIKDTSEKDNFDFEIVSFFSGNVDFEIVFIKLLQKYFNDKKINKKITLNIVFPSGNTNQINELKRELPDVEITSNLDGTKLYNYLIAFNPIITNLENIYANYIKEIINTHRHNYAKITIVYDNVVYTEQIKEELEKFKNKITIKPSSQTVFTETNIKRSIKIIIKSNITGRLIIK